MISNSDFLLSLFLKDLKFEVAPLPFHFLFYTHSLSLSLTNTHSPAGWISGRAPSPAINTHYHGKFILQSNDSNFAAKSFLFCLRSHTDEVTNSVLYQLRVLFWLEMEPTTTTTTTTTTSSFPSTPRWNIDRPFLTGRFHQVHLTTATTLFQIEFNACYIFVERESYFLCS